MDFSGALKTLDIGKEFFSSMHKNIPALSCFILPCIICLNFFLSSPIQIVFFP